MCMKKQIIFMFLIIFGAVSVSAFDDQPQISIYSRVDQSRITIGDLITYSVIVKHRQEMNVAMPDLGTNLGGFEIRDYREHKPKKENDMIVTQMDYIISTFFTGEFVIPPVSISYSAPGDSGIRKMYTEPIDITVESVQSGEADDIRDIKPPEAIPAAWRNTLLLIAGAAALLGLILLAVILYLRKRAGKNLLPVLKAPPRPPHEIALEALERLKNSDLLDHNAFIEFYTELSEIIRQYINGRFFIVAMEMTSSEILEKLRNADLQKEQIALFERFFNFCDFVKFAKKIPAQSETENTVESAYRLINETRLSTRYDDARDEEDTDNNSETDASSIKEEGH